MGCVGMAGIKSTICILFKRYNHGFLLLYFMIYMPWFAYLEKTVTKNYHVIHMKIDDYIPYIEFFIVPYFLWFGYLTVAFLYFFLTDRRGFYKLCAFLFAGMTIFLIISTIYPNGHYLRPSVFARDNIFVMMTQGLYKLDTATNLFPSIHVFNSIGVHIAVIRSWKLKKKKHICIGSGILMISIVLSTLFLKQHSVFDVITGVVTAVLLYNLVYGSSLQRSKEKVYQQQYNQI
jgi:membrane-associated phospholipid phosphatase